MELNLKPSFPVNIKDFKEPAGTDVLPFQILGRVFQTKLLVPKQQIKLLYL